MIEGFKKLNYVRARTINKVKYIQLITLKTRRIRTRELSRHPLRGVLHPLKFSDTPLEKKSQHPL